MTPRSQLRLGEFSKPMALIVAQRTLHWLGEGHLGVSMLSGLFVSRITPKSKGVTDVVYSYKTGYDLRLILEPRDDSREHARYVKWERDGQARAFYEPVPGLGSGQALIAPPRWTRGPIGSPAPKIGSGGAGATGLVSLVEPASMGNSVWEAITWLGATGNDRRTLGEAILTALSRYQSYSGF